MGNWLGRIVVLVALVGAAGCAAAPAPSPSKRKSDVTDLSGVWTGTIRVTPCDQLAANGRCNAVNDISFTLDQSGSAVTGRYTCTSAETLCRHGGADEVGSVNAGSVSGDHLNLSVRIPRDGSNCFYNADTVSSGRASGVYVCYQNGFPVEQGVWSATRQPSPQFAANGEDAHGDR